MPPPSRLIPTSNWDGRLHRVATILPLLGLAVVLFAAAMTNFLDYDEEQYIAGAYFARQLSVYRDFISFQPPTYTWLLAVVFDLVGNWYLLTARIVTWLFALGTCLVVYMTMVGYGAGRFAAFVLVLGFVTSPFVAGPVTTTRNDILPLFLLVLGVWTCTRHGRLTATARPAFIAGVALGLAAATKYLYLFAPLVLATVFLYADWACPPQREKHWQRTMWFVAGATLGTVPVLYALVQYPEQFIFQTLTFHLGPVLQFFQERGMGEMLTWRYKIAALPAQLIRDGNATLFLILFASLFVVWRAHSRARSDQPLWNITDLALCALLGGALVFALRVGPFAMYYAPVAALAALFAARAVAVARPYVPESALVGVLLLSLLPAWPAFSGYADRLAEGRHLHKWVGVQAHRSALEVAEAVAQQGERGAIATLFPILVLDANPVPREFSGGPFFFRNAQSFSIEEITRQHGAGPATIARQFAAAPPAAIVGGFGPFRLRWNPPMDAALMDYAGRAGYVQVAKGWTVTGYSRGQVWVRRTSDPVTRDERAYQSLASGAGQQQRAPAR
jgi:4-amino-4-deoxy-L-arabinose transferase-like glycosyltransferase